MRDMTEMSQALVHRYQPKDGADPAHPTIEVKTVADFLAQIKDYQPTDALLLRIRTEHPDWQLDAFTQSVIASVEDCMTLIFRITQMAPYAERQLYRVVPSITAALLLQPESPLAKNHPLLDTLDALNAGMVGWTEGLGAGSNKLQKIFDQTIEALMSGDTDLASLCQTTDEFMSKDASKIGRLEDRLAASETGVVRNKQAKVFAANLINEATTGQMVTHSLRDFLHGPWYDSLQLLVNEKGIQSESWQRASAFTETLLWTYQPIDNEAEDAVATKQKLYRIIEHLPNEARELLVALEHNTDVAEAAIEDIENDHVMIVSGQNLECIEFDPIPSEQTSTGSTVSRVLLRKVNELRTGQWFSYSDGDETQLIKLVLKLDDVNQLLFTNRNGMKVMQKSFDEFAYYLSSHVVRAINTDAVFSSTFKSYYQGMIDEQRRHKQLINDRKAEVDRLDEERKKARIKAQEEARELAIAKEEADRNREAALKAQRLEHAKTESEKTENADRLQEFTTMVASLATGAIVSLPDALGEKQECKLAVRIAAADKMIFVDRNGMKAGDYKAQELIQLLVSGDAHLEDKGVEFEDTLEAVVSKLRSDREKAYDDLTGA